ncbi:PIN domain protein [Anatilimnocola aggregata]|uniref:PIN domain protein n=1 Tax=Anatilimnocola aggregata TaxID=2528021 RepID=A0A517YM00_9BACT|nr:PIN domain-containing protein [Anatilimnocola aggregata]QDU31240.1 PIN domain protein [Anatilimnocola aggregata]
MFLDTSGLFNVCSPRELFNRLAIKLYDSAGYRITHGYVLSEFVALATARGFDRYKTLEFVDDIVYDLDVEIVWVDKDLHQRGMALLQSRLDKNYSLCDAISFVLMREKRIEDALTTDRHFEQEGFRRLLD